DSKSQNATPVSRVTHNTETGEEELELRVAELVQAVLDRAAHSALIRPLEPERHQPEYPLTQPDWGSCRDFTVERGRARIEDYMRTWEIHPSWRYSISFLQERELDFQKQFLYRALWGRPTSRAPIPRSTAAVYFIITAPKTRDPALPVEVRFTVESNRTLHEPGRTRFREKWLQDVIESKALLIDSVDF
uniref:Si:dkeyp-81f3.4 n=1 Tax=Astyanax mexicanus TaxID=7994 RepID=A0A8B9KDX0_ASTMX